MAAYMSQLTLICIISDKPCQIARPLSTINQNVWFQGGICREKFQLDQIQTMADNWTITIKQNVRFQLGICCEKFQLDQIQTMADN